MLSLPVSTYRTQISGLGGTIVGNSNLQCLVNIKLNYSAFKLQMNTIVISKLVHFLPYFQHLEL